MTKKTVYSLLFLCITLQFACTESKNKQPDYENLSEIYKGLFEAICKEKDILRVSEVQVPLDSSSLENLSKIKGFKNINMLLVSKQEKFRIAEFWKDKKSIVSAKQDEYYSNNYILLREDSAYFKFSIPQFNNDFSSAAVSITYECGKYCSYNEFNIYRLEDSDWKFKETISGASW